MNNFPNVANNISLICEWVQQFWGFLKIVFVCLWLSFSNQSLVHSWQTCEPAYFDAFSMDVLYFSY
jgi:hypothetical protein